MARRMVRRAIDPALLGPSTELTLILLEQFCKQARREGFGDMATFRLERDDNFGRSYLGFIEDAP